MDSFIFQILSIRKTILLVFASSIILGPPSIILSAYLFAHPSFQKTLDAEDDFGEVLEVLLFTTITVASALMVFGIRQYASIGSWDKKFKEYVEAQKDINNKIMEKYGLSAGVDD